MKTGNTKNEPASFTGRPLSQLPETLVLTFSLGGEAEISRAMEQWAGRLDEEGAGKLTILKEAHGMGAHLPSLALQGEGASEIVCHFVPKGPEEEAFRELLWRAASLKGAEEDKPEEPDAGSHPAELTLFVANECPNCPRAVRILHSLAIDLPHLSVHLFEATLWPELAQKNEIKSVPTLLVGEKLRFVGELKKEKISPFLTVEDPDAVHQEYIRQCIRDGKALEAGPMITEVDDPCFLLEDLQNSTFQDRVGLLLALDEAMEIRPDCLEPLVKGLLPTLDSEDAALRGDIADLLGRIGRPDAIPALEKLSGDPNPDVAEAAADAVEAIRSRQP